MFVRMDLVILPNLLIYGIWEKMENGVETVCSGDIMSSAGFSFFSNGLGAFYCTDEDDGMPSNDVLSIYTTKQTKTFAAPFQKIYLPPNVNSIKDMFVVDDTTNEIGVVGIVTFDYTDTLVFLTCPLTATGGCANGWSFVNVTMTSGYAVKNHYHAVSDKRMYLSDGFVIMYSDDKGKTWTQSPIPRIDVQALCDAFITFNEEDDSVLVYIFDGKYAEVKRYDRNFNTLYVPQRSRQIMVWPSNRSI